MLDPGTDAVLGLGCALAVCFLGTALVICSRLNQRVQQLVILGLWIRVAGSLCYLYLIEAYYGRGDYDRYLREGLQYADIIHSGNLTRILEPWLQPGWWGTSFVEKFSGIVLAVIGPSAAGAFVVFAVLGYVGLLALALAFQRSYPRVPVERYLLWLVLFPSLWFWPAAPGKDALVLAGLGLAVLGFVGRRGRTGWLALGVGVFLVFAIRPQVAGVLVVALAAGHWLATAGRVTLVKTVQGAALLVGAGTVLLMSSGLLETRLFRPDEVGAYLENRALASTYGGSALVGETEGGLTPWAGLTNVLFRPFLWEAGGVFPQIAALEVMAMWVLTWIRRRQIVAFLRAHKGSRLVGAATIFITLYAVTLGMALGNLGIVARQRIHLFPFIFMFFVGRPGRAVVRHGRDEGVSLGLHVGPNELIPVEASPMKNETSR